MSKYTIADGEDRDLDKDPITLPDGRVLDNKTAEEYGEEVANRGARRRGRPSLTGSGEHSPKLFARVAPETKAAIDALAERDGVRTSEVVRRALDEYLASHA